MTYDKWSGWDAPELESQYERGQGENEASTEHRKKILAFLDKQPDTKEVRKIKKWMEKYFEFWK